MTILRAMLAVPFRLVAIVVASVGVVLVILSLGLTLMAEVVAE